MIVRLLSLAVILCIVSCTTVRQLDKPYDQAKTQKTYMLGTGDAAKPQPWEITNQLTAIKEDNADLVWKTINGEKYILVSSWKGKDQMKYYKNDSITGFYNTSKYSIWVTTAPTLQNLCRDKKFGRKEGLNLRLKQMLGLPPNAKKAYFIEFWVKPADLFRPCPDAEIDDTGCGLEFPSNATDTHKAWINDNRLGSYYNGTWDSDYPWTQLGYTYDWNEKNKMHVGMSEFVIDTSSNVVVNAFYTTEEYCKIME